MLTRLITRFASQVPPPMLERLILQKVCRWAPPRDPSLRNLWSRRFPSRQGTKPSTRPSRPPKTSSKPSRSSKPPNQYYPGECHPTTVFFEMRLLLCRKVLGPFRFIVFKVLVGSTQIYVRCLACQFRFI